MEFPCGLCREPLQGVDNLKTHVKREHEVVKYRLDLVVALSTLDTWEERRLVEVGKQRLASLEVSGQCLKGGLFLEEVNSGKKMSKDDKEGMRMELEEIRKMLLESSDDQDEDLAEKTNKEDVEIIEVFESGPKEPRNRVFERRSVKLEGCPETPPPSLPPTPSQDPEEMEVEVLEIIEKHQKLKETKSESRVKTEEKTPSAPPTPRSSPMSDVAREYSIKIEPEIEMVVDGVAQTEELAGNDPGEVEGGRGGGGGVDQSLPFCRLCYITFTSRTDQLPHEQQVHSSDQDRRALNADMTQLTLEDFSNNCGICALKFLTKNSVIHHQKVEHRVGVERTVQCEKCSKVMKPSSIYLHRKTHQEKEFKCKLCYASYRAVSDLKKHEENKHKEDQVLLEQEITQDDLKHQCDRCDLKFVAEKFLENHVKSHKSKTEKECRLCYKPYRFTRDLKQHEERQHKREAEFLNREILESDLSYRCSKCDKKFVSTNLLGSHSRLHEMEKYNNLKIESFDMTKNKFECKFCYSNHQRFMGLLDHIHFAHSSDLDRINEKIITADLIFPCNNCDKMFTTQDILSYHTSRFHTTKPKKLNLAKTQKCENCSEAFIHFNTLRKHCLAVHGTILKRPIETVNCRLCEKPVRGKGNLATHVRNRHKSVEEIEALKLNKIEEGSLQYRCGYCYKKFLTKNVLSCHRQFCKEVERKSQNCDHCPETFRHRHLLKKHCLTVHNKKLREKIVNCKLCGKSLRGNHNLRAHEKSIHKSAEEIEALKLDKIEDESLTFNCQHCNKRFLNEKVLRHHNTFCYGRSNQESTQRDCSLCLVEFASNRVLKEHVNNVHRTNAEEMKALKSPETVSLNSKCKFCQADILNKHVLKYHYDKVHREEEAKKTWSCEFCKKEFKPDRIRTSLVGQHMRDEHDLPEYNCLEVKVESNKLVTNQAKQNFQLMLAKMLGQKS